MNNNLNSNEENNKHNINGEKNKAKEQKMMPVSLAIGIMIVFCVITFVFTSSLYNNRRAADIADAVNNQKDTANELTGMLKDIADVDALFKDRYVGEMPSDETLVKNMLSIYIATVGDVHGYYFSKEELKDYADNRDGTTYGIGIISFKLYDEEFDGIYVSDVIEDSPAEKAGLKKGDIIQSVDGVRVKADNFDDLFDSIKGEINTEVKLTVKLAADDSIKEISVVRGEFKNKTVFYEKYTEDTAYINITNFYDNTDEEFISIIDKAKKDGIKKYVFDVRGNLGGNLDSVVNMLDYILPEGPIIRIVNKDQKETVKTSDAEHYLDAKFAVIINNSTASAAELFAAAIRDYNLGKLVGVKTYGKGSMQSIVPLDNGGAVKLTDNKYMPPYGECYDGIGISPDVEVELTEEQQKIVYKLSLDDDPQMQSAVKTFEE